MMVRAQGWHGWVKILNSLPVCFSLPLTLYLFPSAIAYTRKGFWSCDHFRLFPISYCFLLPLFPSLALIPHVVQGFYHERVQCYFFFSFSLCSLPIPLLLSVRGEEEGGLLINKWSTERRRKGRGEK
ncbi:hypothetical protein, unlikely [Trypanosoma brucei brucei TREU927]|uniref:Uncharacterized protein n=1 Tax=Trypanosoma brucei brucei (strain 927/4 GUTat10.1) TaxID=185431 RepID=Q38D35_TRYB2|nr:hypothetical protein, unlikely [Trypanosoma brucei brucei TREU927]EAN77285.1 hypothetical protein, unlikely [Trypanosoma brucei brucei TREU927]